MPEADERSENWRYLVHDGAVFCPLAAGDVDAHRCLSCPHRREPAGGTTPLTFVRCLPPSGSRLSSRIAAVARA